ncbi:hypothetical protein CKK34_3705 [Yarrowia sp. E02]|nr:hypothetical protein CKK34_3705 [Yarrowia sp. E02]
MLFRTKAKPQTQKPLPPTPPPQLSQLSPAQTLDLSFDLEPTFSEKMYQILNQGPLGLVSLDHLDGDAGDRSSIDMMAILEEGPGRRSVESVEPFQTPRSTFWEENESMKEEKNKEEITSTPDTASVVPDTPVDTNMTKTTTVSSTSTTASTDELDTALSASVTPATSNSSNGSGGSGLQPIGEDKMGEEEANTSTSTIDAGQATSPLTDDVLITLTNSQGSDSSLSSSSDEENTRATTPPSSLSPSPTLSPKNKSQSSPNLADRPLRSEKRSVSSGGLLESPLPQPPRALASVLYVSQNPNAKSRSPATSRSASPHKLGHRRDSSSDGSEVPSTTNTMSFKSMSLKSDSSDSDSHSVRSMRSFRSSFRSFSHDSLFQLKRQSTLSTSSPLAPIFSNASTSSSSHDVKALESALSKFNSKQGTPKANILRIELLTLLRKESPVEALSSDTVNIFSKWWKATLEALRTRASSHDKIAYMEALSKLMDRPEWKEHNSSVFSSLVYDTVRYCADKLSLKSVSVPLAAFSGKTFAYAFFHCPGVAHQLLAHLQVPAADLERIGPICDSPVLRPPVDGKPQIPLGPWIRRWASSVSDTFYSFLKHYYCISGGVEADGELPPGWIHVHAFILGSLDAVVRPRKPPAPPSLTPCIPKPRKIHKLKLLGALRELKKSCHADYFAHVLAPAIEDILKAVSLKTVVYDVEQCTALADLAEEMLVALESPLRSLDAPFWLNVVGIMLRSESHYTTLRALAFLHNTFPHSHPIAYSMYVEFILEPDTLKKYFCHWHPLIRAAYMRVVCYRVLPKATQKMNHCLVTVYTRLITYMEYCRVKESPLPVTDACSRLRIVSRDFEATNVDLVVQNLQNLDFVDIGVRGRGFDSERRMMEPGTPPRSTGSSSGSGAVTPGGASTSPMAARSSPSVTPSVTPRYFEDSPPRVSAFDVEDDLFEGVEKTTVKKWGFLRKDVYAHDEHAAVGTHTVSQASPNGISSQYKFVMESTSRSKTPPGSENFAANDEPSVAYPRLPFDLKDKTKDSQSTLDSAHSATTSNTSMDDEALFRVPLDLDEFKDLTEYVKYWKYAGRSLNEWDGVVREYETFVTQHGAGGVPHMVGDMGRCAPL